MLYENNIDVLVQKEMAIDLQQSILRKQLEELEKEDQVKIDPTFEVDSQLIEDAYNLVQDIKNEWNTVVIATPSGIE